MVSVWFITAQAPSEALEPLRRHCRPVTESSRPEEKPRKVRSAYRDVATENIAFFQLDVADEAQTKAVSMRR